MKLGGSSSYHYNVPCDTVSCFFSFSFFSVHRKMKNARIKFTYTGKSSKQCVPRFNLKLYLDKRTALCYNILHVYDICLYDSEFTYVVVVTRICPRGELS